MEQIDLTLVTTQKNAALALVQAGGFDSAAFEWRTSTQDEHDKDYAITFRNTVSVLVHKATGYFFRFERYRSKYSPAHQLRTRIEPWNRLMDRDEHLRDWLFNLRMELEEESRSDTAKHRIVGGESNTVVHGIADVQSPPLKVFVSHSTQDRPFVERFARDLRANGVDAWYSGWEIKPGDSIRKKIEVGLEACKDFIIVLSKSSISRPWVQTELDAATIMNINGKVKKIIPIKIEDCGDLPPTLGSLCWEDFSNQPYETALKRVLDSILDVDVKPPLGKPRSENEPDPVMPPAAPKRMPKRPTPKFPIHMDDLQAFANQLEGEGFDSRTDLFNGQFGLIVGPKGLDSKRMPPDAAGLFFPLWELNHKGNRALVSARRFHDIFENRPSDWKFNRPNNTNVRHWNRSASLLGGPHEQAIQQELIRRFPSDVFPVHIDVFGGQAQSYAVVHVTNLDAGIDETAKAIPEEFIGAGGMTAAVEGNRGYSVSTSEGGKVVGNGRWRRHQSELSVLLSKLWESPHAPVWSERIEATVADGRVDPLLYSLRSPVETGFAGETESHEVVGIADGWKINDDHGLQ